MWFFSRCGGLRSLSQLLFVEIHEIGQVLQFHKSNFIRNGASRVNNLFSRFKWKQESCLFLMFLYLEVRYVNMCWDLRRERSLIDIRIECYSSICEKNLKQCKDKGVHGSWPMNELWLVRPGLGPSNLFSLYSLDFRGFEQP